MNLKRLLLGLLLACLLAAQVVAPWDLADITGDGASHAIAIPVSTRWFEITCPTGNSSPVRIGASDVSTSRGTPIAPGGSHFFPTLPLQPQDNQQARQYTSNWYYLAQSGDKLSVLGVK